MNLHERLKELRVGRNMTQEAVAQQLGVSAQTVSKWERGLLSPDISLLPKIAVLFKCSIDSLFDMDMAWSIEHRNEFKKRIRELHAKQDWEGVYRAWMQEIELNPDHFDNYADVMLHVFRKKLYSTDHVKQMISLADHAEKSCTDDDMRNEIYRVMLQICSESEDPKIKEKGRYYYKKLPLLRHSREVYAKYVMEGEEYRAQILKNIIHLTDAAECSIRQLIVSDMPPEEKLFYYQKAAAFYETVLDGKYAGFYDVPLLSDYAMVAALYVQLEQPDQASVYIHRILKALEQHLTQDGKNSKSRLLYATVIPNTTPTERLCQILLDNMMQMPELKSFRTEIAEMRERYVVFYQKKGDET